MNTTKRTDSQADATSEQQLAGFIKKFDTKKRSVDSFSAQSVAQAPTHGQ
jgi:hypothetical protein